MYRATATATPALSPPPAYLPSPPLPRAPALCLYIFPGGPQEIQRRSSTGCIDGLSSRGGNGGGGRGRGDGGGGGHGGGGRLVPLLSGGGDGGESPLRRAEQSRRVGREQMSRKGFAAAVLFTHASFLLLKNQVQPGLESSAVNLLHLDFCGGGHGPKVLCAVKLHGTDPIKLCAYQFRGFSAALAPVTVLPKQGLAVPSPSPSSRP